MRKSLLLSTILFVSVTTSCVDKAYDLNNISDKEVTVGGNIQMPLVKIDIPLEDFNFSDITPLSAPRALVMVTVPPSFDETFKIDAGFDLGNYIGESGETILKGNITSPFPFPVKVSVSLKKGETDTMPLIVEQPVSSAPATTQITPVTLTKEQIDFLVNAQAIQVLFATADSQPHEVDLDLQQSINIFLSILKKGGIKL